jgi:hypothetical protein
MVGSGTHAFPSNSAKVSRAVRNASTTAGTSQRIADLHPMMQTATPVPVEGGMTGGALPMSAGTSFYGRRKPNGSACQRRTKAGIHDAAKHAMSAMSPLKSWLLANPQPQR